MRWVVLLVLGLSSSVHAAPDTPRAWADRLATHYAHAESLTIEESDKLPPNRPCSEKRLYQLEPGYAALKVSSPDSNLFQDAAIRIARVKRGTDVVRAVRAEVKRAVRQDELPCHGDKRYNAVLQAGDMLFIYGARCSEMYTPFVYDVADLAAAIEAEGGALHARTTSSARPPRPRRDLRQRGASNGSVRCLDASHAVTRRWSTSRRQLSVRDHHGAGWSRYRPVSMTKRVRLTIGAILVAALAPACKQASVSADDAGDLGPPDATRDGGAGADAAGPPPVTYGTTYYVRTDGGDAAQCTGLDDAPYPGSGTSQACAWNHPFIAIPPSGTTRILGSDSLIIGSGTYELGMGGYMQPIPSGASTTTPTRILGKDCATPPRLVGINSTHRVLNLEGSSNVEIGCLEITDGSDCVFNHSNASAKCVAGGAWARGGLYASASSNVWLHDLDIHGMAARAIQAGGLTDWTVERVKMNRNGLAGWAGNVSPASSSNSGSIVMRDIEIGWNGCGERVATGEAWACWGQQSGGITDGLGTATTGGQWLIEDAYIHHNTADGLDLLYMDGADTSKVTLRRVYSVANAGNQVKVSGNALIENSVLVGHCTFFKGKYFMLDGDSCRAYGATLILSMTGGDTAVVRHNTLAGEGEAQIGYTNGDATDTIEIHNNVVVGFPYFLDSNSLTPFSAGRAPAAKTFSGNLAWNVASCPTGAICGQNPRLTDMTLASFDGEPLPGSPVINAAPPIPAVIDDFLERPRPVGAAPDIGAYEVQTP